MYLGIDLGTSCVKVVILDDKENLIAQASSPLDISRPRELWSEQDPQDWWLALNLVMEQLKSDNSEILMSVEAIGLAGQMHGATLLNTNNEIIRPAILWNDGRSFQECMELEQAVSDCRKITGNMAMPGFTAPKISWVRNHESDLFESINKVLLPKDYLRFLMTGDYASDMSDSAGTLWLDVEKRQWSNDMLKATGLTEANMPKLFEGTEITGTLTNKVATKWGMKCVPVAGGGGDNAAGAVGIGVINSKEAFLSLGTSGVYFVSSDKYQSNPDGAVHTFCHCLPDRWHQMSVVLSAASCLTWVTLLTGALNEQTLLDEISLLDFSESNEVIFLPYLSGERTPHNDPSAKGVFFGLTHNSSRATLGRAVLEGVAFAFADAQQALLESGTQIDTVSVIGGGSRNLLWGEILASVLQRPLVYRKGADVGPAYGAARLARISISGESPTDVCRPGKVTSVVQPNEEMSNYYRAQYQTYKKLYTSLKEYF